jgi:hypothetical protein
VRETRKMRATIKQLTRCQHDSSWGVIHIDLTIPFMPQNRSQQKTIDSSSKFCVAYKTRTHNISHRTNIFQNTRNSYILESKFALEFKHSPGHDPCVLVTVFLRPFCQSQKRQEQKHISLSLLMTTSTYSPSNL